MKSNLRSAAAGVAQGPTPEQLDAALNDSKPSAPTVPQTDSVGDAVESAPTMSEHELLSMMPSAPSSMEEKKVETTQNRVDSLLDPGMQGPTASDMATKMDSAISSTGDDTDGLFATPSLVQYTQTKDGIADAPAYPEESKIRDAVENSSIPKSKIQELGNMTASERAKTGAMIGGGLGAQTGGHYGAMMGAAIGAHAARAAGFQQSGEAEIAKRNQKIAATMLERRAVNKKGQFTFEDGSTFQINPDPSYRLDNTSPVTGKKNRSIYEIDDTHPFARRSTAVARPLAYMLVKGMLGYNKADDPQDTKSLDNATGLLVNAMQKDAKSVDTVYSRARELAKKFGVTEKKMTAYLSTIKKDIPDTDAEALKYGMGVLFAEPAKKSRKAA